MRSFLKIAARLIVFAVLLTACAAPLSQAAAPAVTPTEPDGEVATAHEVRLATGHYQLIMFYSPI